MNAHTAEISRLIVILTVIKQCSLCSPELKRDAEIRSICSAVSMQSLTPFRSHSSHSTCIYVFEILAGKLPITGDTSSVTVCPSVHPLDPIYFTRESTNRDVLFLVFITSHREFEPRRLVLNIWLDSIIPAH